MATSKFPKADTKALTKHAQDLTKRLQMHYQFMLRSAAETPEHDYSQTAIAELDIKADAMAIVSATQDTATFIRGLQELWLFGSLDTLAGGADEEEDRKRAVEIAGLVERLARAAPKDVMEEAKECGTENGTEDGVKR